MGFADGWFVCMTCFVYHILERGRLGSGLQRHAWPAGAHTGGRRALTCGSARTAACLADGDALGLILPLLLLGHVEHQDAILVAGLDACTVNEERPRGWA